MNDARGPAYRPTIKEMPETERPRERLVHYGAGALSSAELLAIILRTGVAGCNVIDLSLRLLTRYGGLSGLARASVQELCQENGLGIAKAAQLKAALEIGRRLQLESPEQRPQILSPADVANMLMLEMQALEQEQLRVLLLDSKHRVLKTSIVYVGSLNASMVRIGELFREAIRANCAAIIVVHNHPSGDPTPSREDNAVTRQIVEAGRLLNIDVLDHIILGHQRFVSLLERGENFAGP
jgi:DNA repair protein RadC